MRIIAIEPTVFFVRSASGLRHRVRLVLESDQGMADLVLSVQAAQGEERIKIPDVVAGTSSLEVYLADMRQPGPVSLKLWRGGQLQAEQAIDWTPAKHWEVYLVQYSHHDLGYTDLPSLVLREHATILDEVLEYCDRTKDWPADAQFRFLVEQAWSVVQFVETRPQHEVDRLVAAIKRGQIEVSALFGNQTTELCGHEELIRLLYPAFELKRKYGIPIAAAEHNDIPGFSWGLASVLSGAGIRHFSPGVPHWYFEHPVRVHPLWDPDAVLDLRTPGAFWWEAIDGARLLLWNDVHGQEWHPSSYEQALRELPQWLAALDENGYDYDLVSYTVRGGHRDNAPAVLRYAFIAKQWNERWAYPRLINATDEQFLSSFEARWGHTLKTLRGEAPGTDYPLAATCTPRELAVNRAAHDWLLAGEKLATWASSVSDYAYPHAVLDEAYRNTFYFDEHCWGMWHPGGPAQDGCFAEKGTFAYRAAALAHDVMVKAANRIADEISYPEDAYYLTVFNPLSWASDQLVRAPLRPWNSAGLLMHWVPPGQADEGAIMRCGGAIGRGLVDPPLSLFEQPFELVDEATGRSIAYQLSHLADPHAAQPWAAERVALGKVDPRHVVEMVFRAEDIPAMGYKSYRILPCEAWPSFASLHGEEGGIVENAFFRLEIEAQTGRVTSLLDKELGQELADASAPHGLGQVVARWCETGQEELARVSQATVAESGPLFTTMRLQGSVRGAPLLTEEITLYHTLKRVDVNVCLLRDATPNLELYCAFPFQVDAPRFRYESADTVIEPLRDQLPGSNTDYYVAQHWAEVYNDRWGLVWTSVDAPMVEFGGLWPGYVSGAHHGVTGPGYGHPFLQSGEPNRGHIYAFLMYNNFRTNFINVHPGLALFRFALTTRGRERPLGQVPAFGWGAANPPLPVWMKGPQEGALSSEASFCQIDAPNVMVLALKRAEDGHGIILRLIEMEGKGGKVSVRVPFFPILQAYMTNLVEEDQQLVPCTSHMVQVEIKPYAIATVRLVLGARAGVRGLGGSS